MTDPVDTSRRSLLGALGASVLLVPLRGLALPDTLQQHVTRVSGGRPVLPGRVSLTLPPLAENGNSVALGVAVDSPMTATDHVKTVHVFAEKNPLPEVARFHFNAASGRAEVATRMRLADSQSVAAVAVMNDGKCWLGSAAIIVTLAACVDIG